MADLSREEIEELIDRLEGEAEESTAYEDVVIIDGTKVQAASAIRQLLSATEWKPIETAPKDGTEILLTGTMNVDGEDYPEHVAAEISASRPVVIGRWTSSSGCTIWQDEETSELRRVQVRERWHHAGWDVESNGLEPTHWMPLPLPPSPLIEGE
jgi:hypothetical protein